MGVYSGDKSLDAEIYLNLITGELTMDYSMNKYGTPYNSNELELKNDLRTMPRVLRLKRVATNIIFGIFMIMYGFTAAVLTYLTTHGKVKNKNYQVEHQKLMKYVSERCFGIVRYQLDAPIRELVVTVPLRRNLWVGYTLEGECRDKIKSIALKRRIVTHILEGKYHRQSQSGWNLIFEFTDYPQTGKCIIDYV